jgi:hypothetical protein
MLCTCQSYDTKPPCWRFISSIRTDTNTYEHEQLHEPTINSATSVVCKYQGGVPMQFTPRVSVVCKYQGGVPMQFTPRVSVVCKYQGGVPMQFTPHVSAGRVQQARQRPDPQPMDPTARHNSDKEQATYLTH